MAVAGFNRVVGRLADALGLKNCKSAVLRMSADHVVTLDTVQYATEGTIDALSHALESRQYVVIDAYEYARLKAIEKEGGR